MTPYNFDVTPEMLTKGWHMPVLTSERLTIRPFTLNDFDTIRPILDAGFGAASLPERRLWMEWIVRNDLALAHLFQPPYGDRAVVLTATGEVIGSVGLVPSYGPFDTLPFFASRNTQPASGLSTSEVGLFWVIAPQHQRQGYAAEAGRRLIEYAFEEINLKQIIAMTDYDNHASMGVMQKLGMSIERNPKSTPEWFQITGILANPKHNHHSTQFHEENA